MSRLLEVKSTPDCDIPNIIRAYIGQSGEYAEMVVQEHLVEAERRGYADQILGSKRYELWKKLDSNRIG